MRKTSCMLWILLPIFALVCLYCYMNATDFFEDGLYKDRDEYPLKAVDVNDHCEYVLVKEWYNSRICEIVTDTQAIKANKELFFVSNRGSLYGTTPDGLITLYRDGQAVASAPCDYTFTKKIHYGTLAFTQVNYLQCLLLTGAEFKTQDANLSILRTNAQKPYYYAFAHSDDLHSLEQVHLLSSNSSTDQLPIATPLYDDIIAFTEPSETYAGPQTRHWYFRPSDGSLSQWYWNVRAQRNGLIAYAASYMDGGRSRIILHDMFDRQKNRQVLYGDFPEERDDHFLLDAYFESEDSLFATYIGSDGETHHSRFSLNGDPRLLKQASEKGIAIPFPTSPLGDGLGC